MAGVRRAHTTAAARRQRAGPSSSSADDTTHSTSLSGPIPAREKTNAAQPVADPGAARRGVIERNFDVRAVLAHRGRVARLPVFPRGTNSRSVNFAEGADQLDLATQRISRDDAVPWSDACQDSSSSRRGCTGGGGTSRAPSPRRPWPGAPSWPVRGGGGTARLDNGRFSKRQLRVRNTRADAGGKPPQRRTAENGHLQGHANCKAHYAARRRKFP